MRLNPFQINRLAKLITDQLISSAIADIKNEPIIKEIVEKIITADLKKEVELEKEAEMLIRKHSKELHTDEVDFEMVFKRVKYELAKKKGFKL